MGVIHDSGEALVDFTRPFAALEDGKIDAGIDIEQHPLEFGSPIVVRIRKHVGHNNALRESTTIKIGVTAAFVF
jgi:hypothetical protein